MFVGRAEEHAHLAMLCTTAANGRMAVAVIEGEAGIGKSALLRVAAEDAIAAGFTVLTGRGDDLAHTRPLLAIAEALHIGLRVQDPERRRLARQLAGVDPAVAMDVAYVVGERFGEMLESAALVAPVFLSIDDLQWGDEATLALLLTWMRQLQDLPVAMALACRPLPRPPALRRLLEELPDGTPVLQLGRLSDAEVDELAQSELGAACDESLSRELGRGAGNPFYVREILRALELQRAVQIVDGRAIAGALTVSNDVRASVLTRVRALGERTVDVLSIAAVLGTRFAPGELAELSGCSTSQLLPLLRQAVAAGVLEDDGKALAFRHDLIREVMYEAIPSSVRAAFHYEAAALLRSLGAGPPARAPHLVLAARGSDPRGVDLLVDAVFEIDYAPTTVELGMAALDLLPPRSPRRDPVIARLAMALIDLNRVDEAEQLIRGALDRVDDPALARRLRGGLRTVVLRQRCAREAETRLKEILSMSDLLPEERWWVAAMLAQVRTRAGDTESALELIREVDERDDLPWDLRVFVDCTVAWAALGRGHVAAAVERSSRAHSRALGVLAPPEVTELNLGVVLLSADDLAGAERVLRRGYRRFSEMGMVGPLPTFHWALTGCAFFGGDWDGAVAESEAGLELVARGEGVESGVVFAHAFLALIALFRGDRGPAVSHLDAGDADVAAIGPQLGTDFLGWARALQLEADGDPAGALQSLGLAWDLTATMRYFVSWRCLAPDLVRMALAVGDRSRATEVVEVATEGALRAPQVAGATASARWCRALLDGDPDELVLAAATLAQSPRTFDAARSAESAARALSACGRHEDAARWLDAAVATYDGLGATSLAQSARTAVGRSPRTPRRRRPRRGWESLTPAEERVAALVAAGRSNPEIATELFLSRHTVESHVRHALAKLDMKSRVELAVGMSRRTTIDRKPG